MMRRSVREYEIVFDRSSKRRKYLEWGISKNVGRAISDYGLIRDGDKVLVRLCGEIHDLVLLKILSDRRSFVPIHYEVLGGYVDFGATAQFKDFLAKFCEQCGCRLIVKKSKSLKIPRSTKDGFYHDDLCEDDLVVKMAGSQGCSKIALSAHKDDAVRVLLENLLFKGVVAPLEPVKEFFKMKLAVIRPLLYVQRREIEEWAQFNQLPLLKNNVKVFKSRQQLALEQMIDRLMQECPAVKTNILRSHQRIKKDYLY